MLSPKAERLFRAHLEAAELWSLGKPVPPDLEGRHREFITYLFETDKRESASLTKQLLQKQALN